MSGTLRLRGSTSGYSELQAPAVAADQTFVLPTAGGTLLTTDSPVPKLTLELGSASQPSLTFQGDTDTGLFSEGTNTLNLVTGGSSKVVLGAAAHTIYAGTGATVRAIDIDSSGNVGVGTSSPDALLQIGGLDASGTARGGIAVKTTASVGTFSESAIYIEESSGAEGFYIGVNSDGGLFFSNSGATTPLFIGDDDNVGIGTTSPGSALEVKPSSSLSTIGIQAGTINSDSIRLQAGGTANTYLEYRGYLGHAWFVDSTERARIDSSGRLLIGTTTEGYASADNFTVADSGNCGVTIRSGAANLGTIAFSDATSGGGEYSGYIQYSQASTYMAFATNENERMRLDSAGNARILIGTSSIIGGTTKDSYYAKVTILGRGDSTGQEGRVAIVRDEASTAITTNEAIGNVFFADANGNSYAAIEASAAAGASGSSTPGNLKFKTTSSSATNPLERIRINSAGSFLLTANSGVDNLYSYVAATGTSAVCFRGGHSATPGTPGVGTDSIYIYANGNIQNTNNSYGPISDVKLKENIVDANSQWDDIKALRVVNFNFKQETGHETHKQLGFIAQEVEQVSPGLVYDTPDRDEEGNDLGTVTKVMQTSVLYTKAVKALQEAMERIETLEQRLADAGIAQLFNQCYTN